MKSLVTTLPAGREHPGSVDSGRAWSVAIAGSAINTWAFGVFYSFGAGLEEMADEFDAGLGATAAVFSITTFLFFAGGLVAGPLSDRVGPRPLVAGGAVLMGVGLMLTAEVQSLEVGYLTYGAGVGIGIATYLVPLTACVGGWFVKQRGLALGVYSGGIGFGTLLLVPVAEWLIRTEGWRAAFRLMGFGTLVVFFCVALVVRRPPGAVASVPAGGRRDVLRSSSFLQMYFAGFFMTCALFVPFVFIVKYATDNGSSPQTAAWLISVIGVGSVVGRLGLGALGSKLSPARLSFLCYALQPPAYLLWLFSGGNFGVLVIFSAILGAAYGGYVALGPVLAADLYGIEGLGGILGVLFTSAGLGGLIGPIAAGIILDQTGSFSVVIGTSVGLTTLATLIFLPLWQTEPAR